MKAITPMRAASWVGVALVGWSLNIRWGDSEFLGNGPPVTYHKHVVGALLLAFVAAAAVSASQKWAAKGIGVAAAIGAAIIPVVIRRGAPDSVLGGSGWLWLAVGAALVLLGAGATLAVKPPLAKAKARSRRRR